MISPATRSPSPADFTIVIPTYNERDRIGALLEQIFDVCERDGLAFEVVIVDDNSADGTGISPTSGRATPVSG